MLIYIKVELTSEAMKKEATDLDGMAELSKSIIATCLRNAQVTINLEEFNTDEFPVFQRSFKYSEGPIRKARKKELLSGLDLGKHKQTNGDSHLARKLAIKVEKISRLESNKDKIIPTSFHDPYVVVEIDEPSQKFKTGPTVLKTDSVCEWNEQSILYVYLQIRFAKLVSN